MRVDPAARMLGVLLGLGDLSAPPPCMGYANACVCKECLRRQKDSRRPKKRIVQPWEGKDAA